MRILVVDDDDDFRDLLRMALERAGHEVTVLPSGKGLATPGALDLWDAYVFDLSLGYGSPTGIELLEAARRAHPDRPRVAVTATVDLEEAFALESTGYATTVLGKMFSPSALIAAVERTP